MNIEEFQKTVWDYYAAHRRDMPWRDPGDDGTYDPYKIMVSELMLQQTQVSRVIPKYEAFLRQFPTAAKLAAAPLGAVLAAWSGLGYNRRARFLWQAAIKITNEYNGEFPRNETELINLPGIGANTAAAICAYAYDQPVAFIETNIRTVYIHHFFEGQKTVSDKDILALVTRTLPSKNYRGWYYALMDYGSHLKAHIGNMSTRSHGYKKQPVFHGSKRQVRGQILRLLADGPLTIERLSKKITDERLPMVIAELEKENLLHQKGKKVILG